MKSEVDEAQNSRMQPLAHPVYCIPAAECDGGMACVYDKNSRLVARVKDEHVEEVVLILNSHYAALKMFDGFSPEQWREIEAHHAQETNTLISSGTTDQDSVKG